jgi:predicted RNase H-like HicB family nuclease
MDNKYARIVRWSEEDECYIAEIPELESVIAHGDTAEEAMQEVGEALELYLETLEGDAPQPMHRPARSGNLRVRMPPDLHDRLAVSAKLSGMSLNAYVVLLLREQATLDDAARRLQRVGAEWQRKALDAATRGTARAAGQSGPWRQTEPQKAAS